MAIFSGSFLGCFTTEESYPDQSIAATCSMYFNCYKGEFYQEWDDMDECIDDGRDAWDDNEDFFDDCDFDADQAVQCLAAMNAYAASCSEDDADDVSDECEDVYTDCR